MGPVQKTYGHTVYKYYMYVCIALFVLSPEAPEHSMFSEWLF